MKLSAVLLASLMLVPTVSFAGNVESQGGYSKSRSCYRKEYREEYIPGTEDSPGYVRSWKETIEFPCDNEEAKITNPKRTVVETYREVDDNDCKSGTVLGAIAGGAVAFSLTNGGSYSNDHLWTVPLGMIGGSMVGSQLKGG